jgi:hypothetical protein
MTDEELKIIDNVVFDLRKMAQDVYMACDTEVAVDVCLKTNKACGLINRLTQEIINLRNGLDEG